MSFTIANPHNDSLATALEVIQRRNDEIRALEAENAVLSASREMWEHQARSLQESLDIANHDLDELEERIDNMLHDPKHAPRPDRHQDSIDHLARDIYVHKDLSVCEAFGDAEAFHRHIDQRDRP